MRNGFRSSRGAMRGIIGGIVGFATVAIGFGPFLYAASLAIDRVRSSYYLTGPDNRYLNSFGTKRSIRWPPVSWCSLNTGRDKRWNRSAGSRLPGAREWTAPPRRALRRPGRVPATVLASRSAWYSNHPRNLAAAPP